MDMSSSSGKISRHVSENGALEKCPIDRLKQIYHERKQKATKIVQKEKTQPENIPQQTIYGFTNRRHLK